MRDKQGKSDHTVWIDAMTSVHPRHRRAREGPLTPTWSEQWRLPREVRSEQDLKETVVGLMVKNVGVSSGDREKHMRAMMGSKWRLLKHKGRGVEICQNEVGGERGGSIYVTGIKRGLLFRSSKK